MNSAIPMTSDDFDAASQGWMANKIRKGAMVYYACTAIQKNGKPCPLLAIQDAMAPTPLCRRHTKREAPEEGDHVSRFRISESKEEKGGVRTMFQAATQLPLQVPSQQSSLGDTVGEGLGDSQVSSPLLLTKEAHDPLQTTVL